MPKHSRFPPYKTKIVSSSSGKTHKHMITIPKPIIQSSWKKWKITKHKNEFIWSIDGEKEILDSLLALWPSILANALQQSWDNSSPLFYVIYETTKPLDDPKSWSIIIKEHKKGSDRSHDGNSDPYLSEAMIFILDWNWLVNSFKNARLKQQDIDPIKFSQLDQMRSDISQTIRFLIERGVNGIWSKQSNLVNGD